MNILFLLLAKLFGATDFVNPFNYEKPIQDILIEMTNGGLDYTFECIGNINTMVSKIKIGQLHINIYYAFPCDFIESCIRSLSQRLGCVCYYWCG